MTCAKSAVVKCVLGAIKRENPLVEKYGNGRFLRVMDLVQVLLDGRDDRLASQKCSTSNMTSVAEMQDGHPRPLGVVWLGY